MAIYINKVQQNSLTSVSPETKHRADHDINPSTAASKKEPVILEETPQTVVEALLEYRGLLLGCEFLDRVRGFF